MKAARFRGQVDRARTLPDLLRTTGLCISGWLFLMSAGGGPLRAQSPDPDRAYAARIDQWHAQREANLKKETGWLSVVGLYPLREGANSLGSDSDNYIIFPEPASAHIGVVNVAADGKVTLAAGADANLKSGSETVTAVEMIPDTKPNTTLLENGRFQFHVIERAGRYYIRLKDRRSEALQNFTHIERFPVDPRWKITARWEPYDPPKAVQTPSILGYESEDSCPGAATFEFEGRTYRLEPTGDPQVSLFFVFGDATNEHETYGGGRFLYTDPPDSSGHVELDFNMAYNPPCVFTPYATCPLPRAGDRLPFRVEAGEKVYGEH